MPKFNRWWILKPLVFLLCLVPMALLIWNAFNGGLSPNPISDITNTTGDWTLRFLMITLAISPLRRITGWTGLTRFRRMLGLFCFFHGCLHFTTYLWLDHYFNFPIIVEDVLMRPYITLGFTGFVLMIPLALTSTRKWIGRLGGKRWQKLHRLIYVTATCGVIHYLWLVKLDIRRPLAYGALLALLMAFRGWNTVMTRREKEKGVPFKVQAG
jgi:methionine sulfoxide reductase heme-binding subunit